MAETIASVETYTCENNNNQNTTGNNQNLAPGDNDRTEKTEAVRNCLVKENEEKSLELKMENVYAPNEIKGHRTEIVSPDLGSDRESSSTTNQEGDDNSDIANMIVQHVLSEAVLLISDSDSSFSEHVVDTERRGVVSSIEEESKYLLADTETDDLFKDSDARDIIQVNSDKYFAINMRHSSRDLPDGEMTPNDEHDGNEMKCENEVQSGIKEPFSSEMQIQTTENAEPFGHLPPTAEIKKKFETSLNIGAQDDDAKLDENTLLVSAEMQDVFEGEEKINVCDSGGNEQAGVALPILAPVPNHPEYPQNFSNYKVCRDVEPGLKECIILETGECVQCGSKTDSMGKTVPNCSQLALDYSLKSGEDVIDGKCNATREKICNAEMSDLLLESPVSAVSPRSSQEKQHKQNFRIVKSPKPDQYEHSIIYNAVKINSELSKLPNMSSRANNYISKEETLSPTTVRLDEQRENGVRKNLQQILAEMEVESEKSAKKKSSLYVSETKIDSVLEKESCNAISNCVTSVQNPVSNVKYCSVSDMETFHGDESQEISHDKFAVVDVKKVTENLASIDTSIIYPMLPRMVVTSQEGVHPDSGTKHLISDRMVQNMSNVESLSVRTDDGQISVPQSVLSNMPIQGEDVLLSTSATRPISGSIPSFKTLQDQQASWLKMFHTLEEEHKADLKTQYSHHQTTIEQMQQQMEEELQKQQDVMQQKLDTHRKLLIHNASMSSIHSPARLDDVHPDSGYVGRSIQNYLANDSHKHFQVSPSKSWQEIYQELREEDTDDSESNFVPDSDSVRRSLEKDFDHSSSISVDDIYRAKKDYAQMSPHKSRSPVPAIPWEFPSPRFLLNDSSELFVKSVSHKESPPGLPTGRELPRAGVYSSPMPMLKRNDIKPARNRLYSSPVRRSNSDENLMSTISLSEQKQSVVLHKELDRRHQERLREQNDSEVQMSTGFIDDDDIATRTRMSLREKYSKHLADLRLYYEQEIQELRGSLTALDHSKGQTSTAALEKENVMLHKENINLRDKYDDQEGTLDSALKKVREMEQKFYGVEFRAREYCDHLAESQTTVSTLRHHVSELQVYCRERDEIIQDMNKKVHQQSDTLKDVYKSLDEQSESAKSKCNALQRIVDKYEALEREHILLKDALNNVENKLYDVRSENVDLNRTVSKLELENKRLGRENDNLRHKLTQTQNLSSMYSTFHDSVESPTITVSSTPPRKIVNLSAREASPSSFEYLSPDVSPAQHNKGSYTSPTRRLFDDSYEDVPDIPTSPVIKAEQELYKLRNMMREAVSLKRHQEPKLQKKFYGSDIQQTRQRGSSSRSEDTVKLKKDGVRDSPSSKSRTRSASRYDTQASNGTKKTMLKPKFLPKPDQYSSPTRFDVSFNDASKNNVRGAVEIQNANQRNTSTQTPVKLNKYNSPRESAVQTNPAVENALEQIKAGKIVSRLAWEDVRTTPTSTHQMKKHEDHIRDRLKTIEDVEHRYDDLQAEKRQLESVLSKIPVTGRVDRKAKKKKEEVEDRLDMLQQELGSVRMLLKKYNVLKVSV